LDIQKVAGHESINTTAQYVDAGKVLSGATLAFNRAAGESGAMRDERLANIATQGV